MNLFYNYLNRISNKQEECLFLFLIFFLSQLVIPFKRGSMSGKLSEKTLFISIKLEITEAEEDGATRSSTELKCHISGGGRHSSTSQPLWFPISGANVTPVLCLWYRQSNAWIQKGHLYSTNCAGVQKQNNYSDVVFLFQKYEKYAEAHKMYQSPALNLLPSSLSFLPRYYTFLTNLSIR